MISLEAIAYIERLLATRGIQDFYLDVFSLVLNPSKKDVYTDGNRGFYYLVTHDLPQGMVIASETAVVEIDQSWEARGITKIQEFSGQMAVHLPAMVNLYHLEFIRVIPRA